MFCLNKKIPRQSLSILIKKQQVKKEKKSEMDWENSLNPVPPPPVVEQKTTPRYPSDVFALFVPVIDTDTGALDFEEHLPCIRFLFEEDVEEYQESLPPLEANTEPKRQQSRHTDYFTDISGSMDSSIFTGASDLFPNPNSIDHMYNGFTFNGTRKFTLL